MAGVVVVIGCCTDAYAHRLSDEVPVLSLQLLEERCRGVPAAPVSPARPPFKVRNITYSGSSRQMSLSNTIMS